MDAVSRISGVFYLLMKIANDKEEALFKFDKTILVKDDQFYLTDILTNRHYEKWFNQVKGSKGKIFILNKGRCGNGGTTGFINYAREQCKGLIVSVPNRSIVISKERYDECCCVYGGAENIEKDKNIRICTWDKTDEVEGYDQFGFENIYIDDFVGMPRFWTGSLLVVDEYHKLIDDSNFRSVCGKIVKTILTTDNNVVLMSATPNYKFIEFLRTFSGKDVETYNVQYDDSDNHKKYVSLQWFERKKGYRMYDIISAICDKWRERKKEYEKYPSKVLLAHNKVAFFYNSVKEISNIVNQMPDTSDVEVLCAKTELHEATVPCYSKGFNPEKQIHFMTSAYFTGMDIDEKIHFGLVVFVGSNSASYLAYSNKTIKQALGRFRGGYGSTAFITDGKVKDKFGYAHMVSMITKLDEKIQRRKKYAGDAEYVKDHMDEIIQENIDYLYYTAMVESVDGWDDFSSFKKMMSAYPEYTVMSSIMPVKLKHYPRARDISFKEYKQKRLDGIKVAYKYAAICEKFIEKYGLDAFKIAGRNEIERKVKLDDVVGDMDIETLTAEYKYDLFLGDGFYKGSYLMSVLDYLGQKCDYEKLEETMMDAFGCFCVYEKGDKSKLRSCLFLCVSPKSYGKSPEMGTHSYYKSVSPILGENRKDFIRVSKKVSKRDQKSYAITDYLDFTQLYSMINNGDEKQSEFFTLLLKDPSLIAEAKQDPNWKKLFDDYKKNQTMISEFYKDTSSKSVKYPHKKDEMEKIDCLIVDIDDSITYNKFKEIYSDYEWTAYPTISNYNNDNWTKFRVILPLAQTLSIPNDSLNILKLLRRMICKYEDKNHQLGSYVNQEQWEIRRVNKGKVIDISQDTVTYLDALLKNLNTYDCKFKKVKKDGAFSASNYWDMDRAIAYYQEHDKDGERHTATFVIKNRLSEDDCTAFEKWLWEHYPAAVKKHWKTHKRIAS